ncbi:hypothetical protein C0989_001677 [Termitomyces sp. Mn162]|nr:hypothetical protein C0989_001677 [Termitomyces sp. Mn162]
MSRTEPTTLVAGPLMICLVDMPVATRKGSGKKQTDLPAASRKGKEQADSPAASGKGKEQADPLTTSRKGKGKQWADPLSSTKSIEAILT